MNPLTLQPTMSEKAYQQSTKLNCYVFEVPSNANKHTVSDAVEKQFGVNVVSVKCLNQKGKIKFSYRKGSRPVKGARSDYKKAYVTLKQGENIPIFAAVEETEEKAQKLQEKVAKAAEKKAKKEAKS